MHNIRIKKVEVIGRYTIYQLYVIGRYTIYQLFVIGRYTIYQLYVIGRYNIYRVSSKSECSSTLHSFFYKNNSIRTPKLKIAKIKNKLRTIPASEYMAQGNI